MKGLIEEWMIYFRGVLKGSASSSGTALKWEGVEIGNSEEAVCFDSWSMESSRLKSDIL